MWTREAARLPEVIPIVPRLREDPFDDPKYLFEPKYDGVRGLLYVSRRDCHFRSEHGDVMAPFQELAYWVREELAVEEVILDGEVIALDENGRQDVRALAAGRGNLHYAAFDALWMKGNDLRGLPLRRRKQALQRAIWATSTVLSQAFFTEERGKEMFRAAEALDLEGVVAKRRDDRYSSEAIWYKMRNRAYTQLEGRRELFDRPPRS